jgi:hypothetical protein
MVSSSLFDRVSAEKTVADAIQIMRRVVTMCFISYSLNDRISDQRSQGENREKLEPSAQNRHKSSLWSEQAHPVGLHNPSDRKNRPKQT